MPLSLRLIVLIYIVRSCSEMDIISAFEAAVPGSNPGGSTRQKVINLRPFLIFFVPPLPSGFERKSGGLPRDFP